MKDAELKAFIDKTLPTCESTSTMAQKLPAGRQEGATERPIIAASVPVSYRCSRAMRFMRLAVCHGRDLAVFSPLLCRGIGWRPVCRPAAAGARPARHRPSGWSGYFLQTRRRHLRLQAEASQHGADAHQQSGSQGPRQHRCWRARDRAAGNDAPAARRAAWRCPPQQRARTSCSSSSPRSMGAKFDHLLRRRGGTAHLPGRHRPTTRRWRRRRKTRC